MLHTTARDARALRRITAWIVASGLALCPATATARPADGPCQAEKQYNVPAKMRDGVTLYADVYRPKGAGSYPVILMRLPYNKDAAQTYVYAPPQFYASHCYIVVIQDVRGQYASEGSFYAFRDEAKDGYDTIEWAAKLPGSNGKVGMYGSSYVGATQWLPATLQPPSLVAIAPAMTSSDSGIIRASFRDSLEKPEPIEPGKIYAYQIAIWPTSNLFKTGHRIRLEISSSNFPHYDRNPNTGRRFGMDSELAVADQTIYHDPKHPSKVVLPVMPSPLRSSDSSETELPVVHVRVLGPEFSSPRRSQSSAAVKVRSVR